MARGVDPEVCQSVLAGWISQAQAIFLLMYFDHCIQLLNSTLAPPSVAQVLLHMYTGRSSGTIHYVANKGLNKTIL